VRATACSRSASMACPGWSEEAWREEACPGWREEGMQPSRPRTSSHTSCNDNTCRSSSKIAGKELRSAACRGEERREEEEEEEEERSRRERHEVEEEEEEMLRKGRGMLR